VRHKDAIFPTRKVHWFILINHFKFYCIIYLKIQFLLPGNSAILHYKHQFVTLSMEIIFLYSKSHVKLAIHSVRKMFIYWQKAVHIVAIAGDQVDIFFLDRTSGYVSGAKSFPVGGYVQMDYIYMRGIFFRSINIKWTWSTLRLLIKLSRSFNTYFGIYPAN
jgi:hypothetical protein